MKDHSDTTSKSTNKTNTTRSSRASPERVRTTTTTGMESRLYQVEPTDFHEEQQQQQQEQLTPQEIVDAREKEVERENRAMLEAKKRARTEPIHRVVSSSPIRSVGSKVPRTNTGSSTFGGTIDATCERAPATKALPRPLMATTTT